MLLSEESKKLDEELNEMIALNEFDVGTGLGQVLIRLSQGEASVAAIIAATAIIYSITRASWFLAKPKACRAYGLNTKQYTRCKKSVKRDKYKKAVATLNSKKSLCQNSKDPSKCSEKVEGKMREFDHKIKKLDYEIDQISQQVKH